MALVGTFTDDFSGTVINTAKWTTFSAVSAGVAVISQNNELSCDFDSTAWNFAWAANPAATGNMSGVKSASTWEISASSVYVRMYPLTYTGTSNIPFSLFGFINETNDEGCAFLWTKVYGAAPTLRFHIYYVMAGGGSKHTDPAAAVAYNTVNHAWLRLREDAGTVYWEAAPDSGSGTPGTWSVLASAAHSTFTLFDSVPSWLTTSRVYLAAGVMDGTITDADVTAQARFDGLNTALTTAASTAPFRGKLALLGCGT